MGSEQDMDYTSVWNFEFFKLQLAQVTERPVHDDTDQDDDYSDNPWRSDKWTYKTDQHQYMQLYIAYRSVAPPNPPSVDTNIPLEHQRWYHGAIEDITAENILRDYKDYSFLVRKSASYSDMFVVSIRNTRYRYCTGFLHMRIKKTQRNMFVFGECSPQFNSVSECIQYYTRNEFSIRGENHPALKYPVFCSDITDTNF